MSGAVDVRMLGEARVCADDTDITALLPRKGVALLVYLAAQPSERFYREEIAHVLWPSPTRASALSNLRYTVWQTRQVMREQVASDADPFIAEGRHALGIAPDVVGSDLERFQRFRAEGQLGAAVEQYGGDFASRLTIEHAPAFADWVLQRREEIQRAYFDVALDHADSLARTAEGLDEAHRVLALLLAQDPLNEDLYLRSMTYDYQAGKLMSVLGSYRQVRRLLRDELNARPSAAIQQLWSRVSEDLDLAGGAGEVASADRAASAVEAEGSAPSFSAIVHLVSSTEGLVELRRAMMAQRPKPRQLRLDVLDTPGRRRAYEGMVELVDGLVQHGLFNVVRWRSHLEPLEAEIRMRRGGNDRRLFEQVRALLSEERSESLTIRLWSLHLLDQPTVRLLDYLVAHDIGKPLRLVTAYDTRRATPAADQFVGRLGRSGRAEFISA